MLNWSFTPRKFNSSPLKIGRAPKGNEKVFQPSIFRGYLKFRVYSAIPIENTFWQGVISEINVQSHKKITEPFDDFYVLKV